MDPLATSPRRAAWPSRLAWPVLLAALVAAGASLAGQVGTQFQVTIVLQPAPGACTAAPGLGLVPMVMCGQPGSTPTPEAAAAVSGAYKLRDVGGFLTPTVGDEATRSGILFGEYTTRTVVVGGLQYVETTVSW